MEAHAAWHILILGSSLVAAAGAAILLLSPLIFEEPPPGLMKARPAIVGAVAFVAVAFIVEWLGVH